MTTTAGPDAVPGGSPPPGRLRAALPLLAVVYVPTALVLGAARVQPWVVPSSLVAPLRFTGREGWYEGLFSAVGVLLWAAAGVATGLAAVRSAPGARSRLLAGGAVVSGVLLLDDLFQLHKPVIPRHLGVPSAVVLLAEALLVAALVVGSRRAIAETPRPAVLWASLAFFVLWASVKALPGFGSTIVIEAGAKFAGVAGWAAYWVDTALATNRDVGRDPTSDPTEVPGSPEDGRKDRRARGFTSAVPSEVATQSSIPFPTPDAEAGARRQGGRHGRQHQRSPGGPR